MSTVTEELPIAEVSAPRDRPHRLTVAQYDEMTRVGILTKHDRVELIEGYLVRRIDKTPPLIATGCRIDRELDRMLPEGWLSVRFCPVILARSEPEPDFLVLRGTIGDYGRRKPGPADIALVVEVSDVNYADDRARRRLYAEAGLPVYWIANARAGRVEVYTDPNQAGLASDYRTRADVARGGSVPLVLDGREVARLAVDDLLCPAE